MSPAEYEAQKEAIADEICARLETLWPGLRAAIEFREVRQAAQAHKRLLRAGSHGRKLAAR